tara:strand:+ start:501 stop:674 length:174 start_codon:yes stop_codon:yes gene_type:complete
LNKDTRKKKSECTPAEWEAVSAARRKSQYTSHRHLGEKANAWLKKPWGPVDDNYKGR